MEFDEKILKYLSREKLDEIITYIKSFPADRFISFADVDKKFNLFLGFSARYLKKYFIIANDEKYDLKEKIYYSAKGISLLLNYAEGKTKSIISKNKCDFIKLYHKTKYKICVVKFYYLADIIKYFSLNIQSRYYQVNKCEKEFRYEYGILLREILYKDADTFLSYKEKIVYYALLVYRNNFGYFAPLKELAQFIKKYSIYNFSVMTLQRYLNSISKKGYLTIKKTTSNNLDYIIHKGPISILYKECVCLFPQSLRRRTMFAPKDFVKPPPL